MDFSGQEIINSARAAAYAAAVGLAVECPPCDDLAVAVGDNFYTSPAEDDAPWYDPTQPESAQFLGVLGLGVTGLGSSPVSRTPVPLIGDGSALGPLRSTQREMAFTVGLIVQSDGALSYALGWLSTALRGGACTSAACNGDTLCMFVCCPGDLAGDGPIGDAELRHLYDVGLLEGPTLGDVKEFNGARVATVTFTLVAGKPWIFREPLATLTDWVSLVDGDRVSNFDPDSVYAQCPQPTSCLNDPTCPSPLMPPRPPVPVSPCYPTGRGNFRRTVLRLDAASAPEWLEMVPVLEVVTGSAVMRRLVVRFWANPQNLPCDAVLDPCSACLDISIGYLPAGSTLTLDARVQRAVVDCPSSGGAQPSQSSPVIYGPQGQAFEWPVFTCPTALCIEVLTQYEHTAGDSRARVSLIPRQDAG